MTVRWIDLSSVIVFSVAGCAGSAGDTTSGPPLDTTPPTITLAGPPPGSVSGVVDLTATATDDRGVTRLIFMENGAVVGDLAAPPWVYHWNTTGEVSADYAWKAVAKDAAGNTDTSATLVYHPGLPTSTLAVIVSTTGASLDDDGYRLLIRGVFHDVTPQDTLKLPALVAGPADITVSGLATNCQLAGPNPIPETLSANTTTPALLAVSCTALLAPVKVSISTIGRNMDPDGYGLALNGIAFGPAAANGTVVIPNVLQGAYALTLTGMSTNCALVTQNLDHLDIISPDTNRVDVLVRCLGPLAGRIVFAGSGPFNVGSHISSSNPDGTSPEQISLGQSEYNLMPSVSPDGQWIVYAGGVGPSLEVIRWDGTNAHALTLAIAAPTDEPAWSPDGARIAFQAQISASIGDHRIWVSDADGSNAMDLTPSSATDSSFDEPAWSPDGTRIAFSVYGQLYIMQADGSGRIPVVTSGVSAHQPSWSPDGLSLAFTGSESDIYSIRIDGTMLTNLTHSPDLESRPHWSRSGSQILYQSIPGPNAPVQLYLMQSDGTGVISIGPASFGTYHPTWGP